MPSEAPVQYGLPSRHPFCAARSGVPGSGWSSASGAASCHALQPPATACVLNRTCPEPRQWRPTRSKLRVLSEPPAVTGREASRRLADAARAAPGAASAKTTRLKQSLRTKRPLSDAATVFLPRLERRGLVDRILTPVRGRPVRALLLPLLVGAALVLAGGAQAADQPRVLVIAFDTDVNPVSQDFL